MPKLELRQKDEVSRPPPADIIGIVHAVDVAVAAIAERRADVTSAVGTMPWKKRSYSPLRSQ